MLLKPLEYREPDSLLRLSIDSPSQGYQDVGFTQLRFEQMSASARSFAALGCLIPAWRATRVDPMASLRAA